MGNITRLFFILSSLLSFFSSMVAQDVKIGLPEISYYSRNQYGGDRQNWRITQNSFGLMFFANNDGLLSFDGVNWSLNRQNEALGCARSVKSVGDRIYVGSYNELGYFGYNQRQQLEYTSLAQSPGINKLGDFWDVLEFDNGVAFYSENGIAIFKNDKLDVLIQASTRFLGMYCVSGNLFVQDITKGLMELKNGQLVPVLGGNIFFNKDIGTIIQVSTGKYIIGTLKDGLFVWDNLGIRAWEVEASPILKNANILCGSLYQNDYLVFGTIQKGLIILNKQGELISQIGKDKGLQNNTVLTVFVDREDNIWCGLDNGIAKVDYNSSVSFLNRYYDLGTGFAFNHFDGYYYLATIQALYRISDDKFNSQLKDRSDFVKVDGTEGQCWSLFKDDESILLGHTFGVFTVNNNSSKLITPPSVNGVWTFRQVPNRPDLLIAGTYDGLVLLEKVNHQWRFSAEIPGFTESARYIEWENENTLLISHTTKGVFRLTFNSDFTQIAKTEMFGFTDFPNNVKPLSLSIIEGECVFVNSTGAYKLTGSNTPKAVRFTKYDTFFPENQFPAALQGDQYGNVWYFYSNRLGVLRKLEDGSVKNIYFPFESLKGKLVNYFENCFVVDKNCAVFTTEEGFAQYLANDTKNYLKPFNVHVTSFRSLSDSARYSYFQDEKRSLNQDELPQFSYDNNSFEVSFAGTFFEDQNIQYSTFLKNYDDAPTSWNNSATRSFQDLKEGKYELTIFAKNKYQVQATPLIFKFVVDPPWYRSIVAKIIYFLLFIIFVYLAVLGFRRYVVMMQNIATYENRKQFQEKEESLLDESLKKEKELIRLKNERLSVEVSFKEKELANLTVHIVRKNDFLSDLKEQLRRVILIKESGEYVRKINNLINKIDQDIENENNWTRIERQFEQVHASFLHQLVEKHPALSAREQKLCAYIKMGMASKEIASLMNISTRAVENNRYKLRQSLDLSQSENLADYIMNLS